MELFPDKLHFFLFSFYICLFVNQGILVTASKEKDGSYAYNTTTVVLLSELVKFSLAMIWYLREKSLNELFVDAKANVKTFVLYLIPSFLYCLYNNLAFVNLKYYDPTSYFLLLNFRTVATGIIFQFLFRKQLTRRQWLALILLTMGCIVKQVRFDNLQSIRIELDYHLVLMLTQVFCSCFAGVYNEFLLKDVGSSNVPLMLQNIFMYVNSIAMNVIFLVFNGGLAAAVTSEAIASVCKPIVLSVALNNGMAGITTSFFLKMFNSILKTFAGAIELLLTALLALVLFGVAVDAFMLISIILVSLAMYLYSTNPVVNVTVTRFATEHKKHGHSRSNDGDDDDEVFVRDDAIGQIEKRLSPSDKDDSFSLKAKGHDLI